MQFNGVSSPTSGYNFIHFTLQKINEVYARVDSKDEGLLLDLADKFSFLVPGHEHMPSFSGKIWDRKTRKYRFVPKTWDGYYRMYNRQNKLMPFGLIPHFRKFCEENSYEIETPKEFIEYDNFSIHEAASFVKSLNTPVQPRDYQIKCFVDCVRKRRSINVLATSSGKSFIIYLLIRYYLSKLKEGQKIILVVPTIALTDQMVNDFKDYGWTDCDEYIHKITGGIEKNSNKPIFISTWQSIYEQDKNYFRNVRCIIGDECHEYEAKSMQGIMNKLISCPYRFGFTGTLRDSKVHHLILEGSFGKAKQYISTSELIDRGFAPELKIKVLKLRYSREEAKNVHILNYDEEIKFLEKHEKRNSFINNLALSFTDNSLILFTHQEHGETLFESLRKQKDNVYLIYGKTEKEARNEIREICKNHSNVIILASYGVFQRGVSINNLHNIVFAIFSKSKIRVLQSIGRGLRQNDGKLFCTLYDISDDIQYGKRENYSLRHLVERLEFYIREKFKYKIYSINL